MDAPHLEAALSAAPEFAARRPAEAPATGWAISGSGRPSRSRSSTRTQALPPTSFRGRAMGGAGRPARARLVGIDGPVSKPRPVPASRLAVSEYRRDGIDRPGWNDAAADVIRGLDQAIGQLCELAERRGAAVLMVSDHGFGPCHGRINVNRILVEAGVAQLPGWAGRVKSATSKGASDLRLWGQKRENPTAKSASFDKSVAAQYPFDWKRTLAFAPHQDTAAMIYVNSASRHGNVKTAAPKMTPRQIDDARTTASQALAAAKHPETGVRLFPRRSQPRPPIRSIRPRKDIPT